MPEYLDQICDFVVKTRYEDLSDAIIEQTKKVVYDTVGVIASGAWHREPRELSKRRP